MINITFRPRTLELEIEGHANHAEKGKDIVCAAVSSLFYTLCESLRESVSMLYEEPIVKDEEGKGYIGCCPRGEYEGNILRSYWTILIGLQMIAEQYPKNVTFFVFDEEE